MIQSMTAYASGTASTEQGVLTWELRSVNQRFLDFSLRLPEEFRMLDGRLRELLKSRLSRGKIEATLKFQADPTAASAELRLNEELASALGQLLTQLAERTGSAQQADLGRLLGWPGLVIQQRADFSAEQEQAEILFRQVLDQLVAARTVEGRAISEMLKVRLNGIEQEVEKVSALLPNIRQGLENRFRERLAAIEAPVETGRVEQELVLLLQKLDIDEEIDRLRAHLSEFRRVLGIDDPIGRRLDFLLQEMNREANTIGSKAQVADTGQAAIEIKVLIEQMREQIQNVE